MHAVRLAAETSPASGDDMSQHHQSTVFTNLYSAAAALLLGGCAVTSHATQPAELGVPSSLAAMEAVLDQPGPIAIETLTAAHWQVPLSGLLNLEHPRARAAQLEERDEPIQIFIHSLQHPTHGMYLVDSGVQADVHGDGSAVGGLVASVAGLDELKVQLPTRAWLKQQSAPLRGVLLTHLHLDHVMGLPDIPRGTALYSGPGEAQATAFENLFVQGTTDRELEGHAALSEWQFPAPAPRAQPGIDAVLDVFGDGSLWALHVPGHTPGSTAYVARSAQGAVLFTGDACHTAWGWQNGVEPGSFSSDEERSRHSLLALRALVQRHPGMSVRLGHQELPPARAELAAVR
jgi:glyoxylase-like metal-dependent hydrolase (beta-lactamase superfamily II)